MFSMAGYISRGVNEAEKGSREGVVVIALVSYHCGLGSIPGHRLR